MGSALVDYWRGRLGKAEPHSQSPKGGWASQMTAIAIALISVASPDFQQLFVAR
jgi:hypothetical protein